MPFAAALVAPTMALSTVRSTEADPVHPWPVAVTEPAGGMAGVLSRSALDVATAGTVVVVVVVELVVVVLDDVVETFGLAVTIVRGLVVDVVVSGKVVGTVVGVVVGGAVVGVVGGARTVNELVLDCGVPPTGVPQVT